MNICWIMLFTTILSGVILFVIFKKDKATIDAFNVILIIIFSVISGVMTPVLFGIIVGLLMSIYDFLGFRLSLFLIAFLALMAILRVRICPRCNKPAWTYISEEQDWSGTKSYFYKGVKWHGNRRYLCFCGYDGIRSSREITQRIF